MPAIYHTKEVDASFEGAIFHVTEAQPNDPVVWHCQEVDPNFNGAIFHIMWAEEGYKGPMWRVVGIARIIEVVISGVPPLSLVGAVEDSLSELKAFGGLLQSGVPSGYTGVEYVENASGTMVKTAIHIGNDDNFKIDITATAVTGSFYLFQARDKVNSSLGNANITGISGATSGNTLLASPGIDGVTVSNGLTRVNRTGHKMRFVYDCADGNISWYVRDLDGNVENTATGTYDPTQLDRATTNMCIYGNEAPAGSGSGQQANRLAAGCKVYGAKLWKNGVLVLDYVPATRNSDSAIGFYDRVSETFVTAADGSLTAGSSLAPTPSDPMDIYCNNGKIGVLDHTNWNVITNPTSQTGQGMFISTEGKLQRANDRGAGVFIPVTVGKKYTLLINKKTTALGNIIRYGQSNNGDLPNSAEQLLDWYRGTIEDGMLISFTAKRPYFVMQLAAALVEVGGIDEAVEVIEAAGDNETIAIRTRNLANVATDIDGKYIAEDGTIGTNANSCYSDIIPVVAGETYIWSCICGDSGTSNNKRIHAYIDGVWSQQIFLAEVPAGSAWRKIFVVPAGCNGIRISHWNTDTETQVELGSTKTAYVAYNDSTATANNLFKLNDYQDVQEIITGATTHKCGILVLNGLETYNMPYSFYVHTDSCDAYVTLDSAQSVQTQNSIGSCTQLKLTNKDIWSLTSGYPNTFVFNGKQLHLNFAHDVIGTTSSSSTSDALAAIKSYIAAQYAAGTPVVVVYPLATEYVEPAPVAQTMNVVKGDNTLSLTQQGMTPLEVSATYMKGVSVTITEIENANVGNDVEVIIA